MKSYTIPTSFGAKPTSKLHHDRGNNRKSTCTYACTLPAPELWKKDRCCHLCLHFACTQISGKGQVLAPMPALIGIMLPPMPAPVGIMLAPCWHFSQSAILHFGKYAEVDIFFGRRRNKAIGTDKTPAWISLRQGPRIFGLTKMLGGYHYRQSRNDNRTPPRSHQPKGKPEMRND